jgi:rubrerythrin
MRRAPAQIDPEEGNQVNPVFDLEALDVSGAIREHEEAVAGDTRAAFFRKAAVGGGALLTSGGIMAMLPELAAAKPSKKQDIKILNYALTLEYLEAAFYTEAAASGNIKGDALAFAKLVAEHENAHVKALKSTIKALHGKPVAKPTFDFKGTNTDPAKFIPTAFVLENTGVHAYLGQAGRLKSKALLGAAASIVTVEARHASAAAILQGNSPYSNDAGAITPDGAFDTPLSMKAILKAVGDTGFVS